MSDSAPSQRHGKQLLSSGNVREPSSPQHLKPASMKQLPRDVHAALLPVLRRYNVPAQQPAEDHLQRHATETSMLKPVKLNPAASPAPCAHIGDCNASWHSPGDLRQGMRELTCTCEEYRAAHNAMSPGMGIVGAYLQPWEQHCRGGWGRAVRFRYYAPKEDCARCLRKSCGRGQRERKHLIL